MHGRSVVCVPLEDVLASTPLGPFESVLTATNVGVYTVMVQLFNDPDKTTELIHKYKLLDLFIGVFCKVVSCCAQK